MGKYLSVLNLFITVLLTVGLFYTWQMVKTTKQSQNTQTSPKINNVSYKCDGGKTINATYFSEKVELNLSDKRNFLLMQGMSGSGIRYTNNDESITFWSKGNTAFIEEGPQNTVTYQNCTESSSS